MLASDDANREFEGARNPDSVLWVQFYSKPTRSEKLSVEAGCATFIDETFVRIMIPGRNDLTIDRPLEPGDDRRHYRQWEQFKMAQSGMEQTVGTPVAEWPIITRSQAEELRAKKFYTVQQIAECSDDQIAALGMNANALRVKARAFVAAAKDTALSQAQAIELKKRDDEIDAMKAQMAEMMELVKSNNAATAKAKKPARKSRELTDEQRAAIGARLKAAREKKLAIDPPAPEV